MVELINVPKNTNEVFRSGDIDLNNINPADIVFDDENADGSINIADTSSLDLNNINPADVVLDDETELPPLSDYLKFKYQKGFLPLVRSSYGREAMWGRMDGQDALAEGNAAYLEQLEKMDKLQDVHFSKAPVRTLLGEAAEMLPFMLSSLEEGLKTGLVLGGGWATIAGIAGVAGPQALAPEELVTVPGSFAAGMGTGMAFGVLKNAMDVEGGNLYLDLIDKKISNSTARPLALGAGLAIGIVELSELALFAAPIKRAFGRMIVNAVSQGALKAAAKQYFKTLGVQVAQEELQEIIQIATEMMAGAIENNANVVPTSDEIKERLIQTAIKSAQGLAVLGVPGAVITSLTPAQRLEVAKEAVGKKEEKKDGKEKEAKEEKGKPRKATEQDKLAGGKESRAKSSTIESNIRKATIELDLQISKTNSLNVQEAKIKYFINKYGKVKGTEYLQQLSKASEAWEASPFNQYSMFIKTIAEKIGLAGKARRSAVNKQFKEKLPANFNEEEWLADIYSFTQAVLKARLKGGILKKNTITLFRGVSSKQSKIANSITSWTEDESRAKIFADVGDATGEVLKAEVPFEDIFSSHDTAGIGKTTIEGVGSEKEFLVLSKPAKSEAIIGRPAAEAFKEDLDDIERGLVEREAEKAERLKEEKVVKTLEPKLPKGLERSAPRFGFGQKGLFRIDFKSDLDKALYIVAQDKKSKSDQQFMNFLKPFFPGKTEEQIIKKGKGVKQIIKDLIKNDQFVADLVTLSPTKFATKGVTFQVETLADRKEEAAEIKKESEKKVSKAKVLKQTLAKIVAGSKPLVKEEDIKIPGIEGRLRKIDKFNNALAKGFYGVKKRFIAITPMDVVFDLMDKAESFTGVNFLTFKRTIDLRNRDRAIQNLEAKTPILDFHKKAKLDEVNYKRILVIATLEQDKSVEGNPGRDKITRSFDEQEINKVEKEGLTKDERTILELMRVEFEKLKPQLLKVMKEVYGKDFKEVKDYFPMLTDFAAMENVEIQNLFGNDAKLLLDLVIPERKPQAKEVSSKFLSERVGGKVPIKTNALEVFIKHVDNATYIINMGKDIQRLLEVAKKDEYKAAVGTIGQEEVVNWLKLMARRGGAEGGRLGALDWLRNNVGIAVLGYKLSTILIQPTALLDGAALIGGYAFKGVMNTWGFSENQKAWRKFIKDNFIEIKLRVADDPAFAAFMDNILDESMFGKFKKHAFTGVRFLDSITAIAIAAGAYEKVVAEKGGKVDFANPDQDAIIEAELFVRRSQASGQFKDLPAVSTQGAFTGSVSVDKLIFQFQTFMLGRASIITQAIAKPTKANTLMFTYLTAALIAEVLVRRSVEEIMALTGDEPDEPFKEFVLGGEGFKKLAFEAIGSIPIVSQAVNAVRFRTVPIPVISFAHKGIIDAGYAVVTEDDKKKMTQVARAVIIFAGTTGVLPGASQMDQIIGKIFKNKNRKRVSKSF